MPSSKDRLPDSSGSFLRIKYIMNLMTKILNNHLNCYIISEKSNNLHFFKNIMLRELNIVNNQVMKVNPKFAKMKLQSKIALLSVALTSFVLIIFALMAFVNMVGYMEKSTANKALSIARAVARSSAVQEAMVSENPSAVLQPIAESWRHATKAAFIVIHDMQEVRLTHPVASKIGTRGIDAHHEPALQGAEYVYQASDILAPSLRATVPIYGAGGVQTGFVSVGFYLDDIRALTRTTAGEFTVSFILAMFCSAIGAFFLARHVKNATFGLEPEEIAVLLKERVATLEVIREGVIAVDADNRVKLLNKEAEKILGVTVEQLQGQSIDTILPDNRLADVVNSGQAVYDEEQRLQDKIILANSVPVMQDGKVAGAVVSFRDRTELQQLAEEITGIHRIVDTLRAQAHEFKNKLQTVAGLVQLQCYHDAVNYIMETKQGLQEQFNFLLENIKDSIIFGLLLGKSSQIKELGISLSFDPDSCLKELPRHVTSGDIVLILGNLLQNAIEAVQDCERKNIRVSILQEPDTLRITVYNSGPWIDSRIAENIYRRGISTKRKGSGLGLALVKEKIDLLRGSIENRNVPDGGIEFTVYIPYNGRWSHE